MSLFGQQESDSTTDAPARPFHFVMVTALVWPGPYTEMEWSSEGKSYRAVSNVDFTLLDPDTSYATTTDDYSWLIAAGKMDPASVAVEQQAGRANAAGHPVTWPASLPPAGGTAQYVLLAGANPAPTAEEIAVATAPVDSLHLWYQAHRAEVAVAAAERAATLVATPVLPFEPPPDPHLPAVTLLSVEDTGLPNESLSEIVAASQNPALEEPSEPDPSPSPGE